MPEAFQDPPSKREVLRSALRLFVRDGLCETSIRNIADESGYTNPALYKFFDSKEALALYLFERSYLEIVEAIRGSQAPEGGFEANLDALLATYAVLVDTSLEALLYVNDTLRHFWPQASPTTRRHSLLGILRRLVESGAREGVIPAGTDVELAVAALAGTMAQVARMVYFGELKRPVAPRLAGLRPLFRRALVGVAE